MATRASEKAAANDAEIRKAITGYKQAVEEAHEDEELLRVLLATVFLCLSEFPPEMLLLSTLARPARLCAH